MCQENGWPCCKLDGSCSIKKRTKMVEDFNNPHGNLFAFLLSSKARPLPTVTSRYSPLPLLSSKARPLPTVTSRY
jgi:hypothetical protein